MKFKILMLCVVLMTIFTSCEKESETNELMSIDISKTIKIIDIKERMVNFDNSNLPFQNRGCAFIVQWDEWGRASRDCRSWGLCNAVWFEPCDERNTTMAAPLDYDDDLEKYFIDILFAQEVPSDIPIDELTLAIDESFQVYIGNDLDRTFIFNEGYYEYNSSLGEYGGIRIILD